MRFLLRLLIRLDVGGPLTRPPKLLHCPSCGREHEAWAALLRCADLNHPFTRWPLDVYPLAPGREDLMSDKSYLFVRLEPDRHARLKTVAARAGQSMQAIAAEAIEAKVCELEFELEDAKRSAQE